MRIVHPIAALILTPLLCAPVVFGHGVQIQITHNPITGKIETRQIVHTGSLPTSITSVTRVYVMPLLNTLVPAGDGWYTRPDDQRNAFDVPLYPTGPGIAFQYDEAGQLHGTGWAYSGSSTRPNLQGTNFGISFTDGLKSWNGASWVDPGTEQVQVFRGEGTSVPTVTANTSDSGPFAGVALASITSKSANPHSSLGFRMLGDGTSFGAAAPGAGDDGIYLLSLALGSTAAGVSDSDPFYFVIFKNSGLADAINAASNLGFSPAQIQVVPEPVGMTVVLMLTMVSFRRRRSA